MGRVLKLILGSGVAAAISLCVGLLASGAYSRHYYPNDPDPVDFTIGGIFLLVWFGIWVLGTVLAAWLAFRSTRPNAA